MHCAGNDNFVSCLEQIYFIIPRWSILKLQCVSKLMLISDYTKAL